MYFFKMDSKDLLCSTWNSAQCYAAAWMGEEFEGEWIHAYVWLSPFAVPLKRPQHYQSAAHAVLGKSVQSCPTFCDPIDCNPPGSSACGILQTRILEWVAMPSSRESSQPRD